MCQRVGAGKRFCYNQYKNNKISIKVTIEGIDKENVQKCKGEILALIDRLKNKDYAEFQVPPRFIPHIVGTNGNKISKLREQFPNVKIDLPSCRENDPSQDDLIKIKGDKDEVF